MGSLYTVPIIDTHMHLWDLNNHYAWLETNDPVLVNLGGNYDELKKNFLVEDYIALTEHHHIVKSIHIEAFGFEGNPILETQWLQKQSDQFGFPHGIVAHAPLHDPHVETLLKQHRQYPNVRGIRMVLNDHNDPLLKMAERGDYLRDPHWRKGFSLLSTYNLSFDLQMYDHQIDDVISLLQEYPETSVILEHLAWPLDFSETAFKIWQERMANIAHYQNVSLKVSGLGWIFKDVGSEVFSRYVKAGIELFGIDRCMFGSNFPPDRLFYSFDEAIMIFKTILSKYPEGDQAKFFYLNAKKVYRV